MTRQQREKAWLPDAGPRYRLEGREIELERLREALARTDEDQLSLVFVEGESGIGKSALLAHFARAQCAREPDTWMLEGRCYEHERAPYKAFAACMDALARQLAGLDPALRAAVLPRHAALLVELFPALSASSAFSELGAQGAPVEPSARRLQAFLVLGQLLSTLAESRPLIIVIDDLQWADEESLQLLRHLTSHDPPSVLFAVTVHPDRNLPLSVLRALEALRESPGASRLTLRGLQGKALEALVLRLLGPAAGPRAVRQVEHESRGHPMLVAELAHYAQASGEVARRLTLEAALLARIGALSVEAQCLLDRLAVCGRPHSEALFRLGAEKGFDDALKALFAQGLVRRSTGDALLISHDRVRATVLARRTPEELRTLHAGLAQGLEQRGEGAAGELAGHWDQAGDGRRAGTCYVRAAQEALQSLAFTSAAEHYARALALLGEERSAERGALLAQYGRALAGAGKGPEAGAAFTEAASLFEGAERVRLRVLVVQHQLQGAAVKEGLRSAREVLGELGVPLPQGHGTAAMRSAWERALLSLRGTKVRVRTDISSRLKMSLDAMAALILPMAWADLPQSSALTMVYLRRALASGDLGHAARALSQQATLRSARGEHEHALPLLLRARELAQRSGDLSAVAFVRFGEGVAAMLRAELETARASCVAAEEMLATACLEDAWLLTNVRAITGMVLWRIGDLRQLAASFARWFAEARARGDVLAMNALLGLGMGHMALLMDDRVEEAQELLERSMRPWRQCPVGFTQIGEIIAQQALFTYQGESRANAWFDEQRAAHDGARLLGTGDFRVTLLLGQALAALSAYSGAPLAARPSYLNEARRAISRMEPSGTGLHLQPLMLAQISALEGDQGAALEHARLALERCRGRGESSVAHSAAYLVGVLEGGETGRARCLEGLHFFREQGWKDPWRGVTMCVPAARVLEDGSLHRTAAAPLLLRRYQLREPLPEGEAAALVKAQDVRTSRAVVLRALSRADPAELSRLKEELRALERVHHENLARIEGLYEHEGRLLVALEPVPPHDFLTFVRPAGVLDEVRLRSALAGTLAGLSALHDAGLVHGELQPALIRADEAKVLLLGRGPRAALNGAPTTEAWSYLSPEQIEGAPTGPAIDVYAVGVCLYEALTGGLPHQQPTVEKLRQAKLHGRPVPPWALRIEVPEDLEELCLTMLDRDPERRPSAHEARELFAGRQSVQAVRRARRARALASLTPSSSQVPSLDQGFVGRAVELNTLAGELERAAQGSESVVCVQGESGIGKSALVQEAIARLERGDTAALVLRSRCYANEQLRLQAFDGVVDALARWLTDLSPPELDDLLPARTALLAQLFPVLGSVPRIRSATKKGLPADSLTRREAAVTAFIALLTRLTERSPLVLVIDDLQWADAESFALISALLAQGKRRRLALVSMMRPYEARDSEVAGAIAALLARPGLVSMRLSPLRDEDATALARSLLGAETSDEGLALAVRESGGHPLFLRELAHARRWGAPQAELSLEWALQERIRTLPREARALLDLLALLARPCPAHVLERAAGLGPGFDSALRQLLAGGLVQRRGPLGLCCFHDRLREEAAAAIAPEQVADLYGQLAEALEAEPESDAAERARLWEAAGKAEHATTAYAAAGERALETLAFVAAERLYRRASELSPTLEGAARARLLAQRARAFVALGQSAEAAALFEQAAQHTEGAEATRLRVLAAQHQIQGAQFEDGMRSVRSVLGELGLPLPASNGAALSRIVWERVCLALRGTNVRVRTDISDRQKLGLDAMSALIMPTSWADLLPGTALTMVHQRKALALGDSGHAARALSQEAILRSMVNEHERAKLLCRRARELAQQSGNPSAEAFARFGEGTVALMRGELETARALSVAAEELLTTACPEEAWLLTNVRMNVGMLLYRLGEFRALAAAFEPWLAEAQARGDVFAMNALLSLGMGHTALLMDDRVEEARDLLERSMRPWRQCRPGFAQAGEILAQMHILPYLGGSGASAWFHGQRAAHDSAFLLKRGTFRVVLSLGRALASFAAYPEAPASKQPDLLAQARRAASDMEPHGIGLHWRPLMLAQVSALEGKQGAALEQAQNSLERCRTCSEIFVGHSAGYLVGVLEGGDAGRARCQESLTFFREQGWKQPWRAATMVVPAARMLEGKG